MCLLVQTLIPAEQHLQPQQALYDGFLSVVGRPLEWERTTIHWVLHHLSSQNPPPNGIVTLTSIPAELELLGEFSVRKFF